MPAGPVVGNAYKAGDWPVSCALSARAATPNNPHGQVDRHHCWNGRHREFMTFRLTVADVAVVTITIGGRLRANPAIGVTVAAVEIGTTVVNR